MIINADVPLGAAERTDFRRRRPSPWRWLERGLLLLALVTLGYCVVVVAESALYQAWENQELDRILRAGPETEPVRRNGLAPRPPGSALGRIEIPALGVSTVIKEGDDARTLRLAVGHIGGTAWPGQAGNVGLAGHRDQFFRRLREIRPGHDIRIVTAEETFTYRVELTHVVDPEDVWVLDPTREETLTLVTCYPFTFIGAAPQRFIVRARRDESSSRSDAAAIGRRAFTHR
jgi:sortase A